MIYKFKISLLISILFGLNTAILAQDTDDDGFVLDKIAAKVDDQIILQSDIALHKAQYQQQNFDSEGQLECLIIENLVTNKLLLAKAEMDSVQVSESQVEQQLNARMSHFISQIGSKQKLEEYYGKPVYELKNELRSNLRDKLILQKMQSQITQDISITPSEVKAYFQSLPEDSIPYYSKEVEVGQIVRVPKIGEDQQLAVKSKLRRIRNKIQNDEASFAAMARKHSEHESTAGSGGELGFWEMGTMLPEIDKSVSSLEPGEVSGIIKTKLGYHLVQLIERRGNEYNARHILLSPSISSKDVQKTRHFLDSLKTAIDSGKVEFGTAAKKYSEDEQTKSNGGLILNEKTGSSKIPSQELDPKIFFIIDSMKVGQISEPVKFVNNKGEEAYRIIYYKSKTEPHRANLDQDYEKIRKEALQQKRQKVIRNWFKKSRSEVYIELDPEYSDCNILKNDEGGI